MSSLGADLAFRGLVHQVTDAELPARLDREAFTVYTGFDPTADSLHVGSLLQLCTLRRFQQAGHRPIALAGGATGIIGDPGGKSEERNLLDEEEVRTNLAGIRAQLEHFLDFAPGPSQAHLVDNGEWLGPMALLEFLRDVGKHFTVNQMVAKESVRSRLERPDQGISYTEFSYMLLQAYDFLHLFDALGCRLQMGGSDQWGNITAGVELIRKRRGAEAFGLTTPLVLKADGAKFGKTEAGTVWLDARRTSPFQLYQFLVQTEDAVVGAYLRFFTFLAHEEILALEHQVTRQPERRDAQRALARAVCALVHGDGEAKRAEAASQALFSGLVHDLDEDSLRQISAEVPTTQVPRAALDGEGLDLVGALVRSGLAPSKGQARTLVAQHGVVVNGKLAESAEQCLGPGDLLFDRYVVLRKGRRQYHLLLVD